MFQKKLFHGSSPKRRKALIQKFLMLLCLEKHLSTELFLRRIVREIEIAKSHPVPPAGEGSDQTRKKPAGAIPKARRTSRIQIPKHWCR